MAEIPQGVTLQAHEIAFKAQELVLHLKQQGLGELEMLLALHLATDALSQELFATTKEGGDHDTVCGSVQS